MAARLTQEEFISRCFDIHGDKYDFSLTSYRNQGTKVKVKCLEHGIFEIWPNNLLRGHGCAVCSGRERITREVFVRRATEKHNNRYDYSKVEYRGMRELVCIGCPVHGDFWQKPEYHLKGNGCQKCYATPKSNTEEFILKAKEKYGDIYDYSKVNYTGNKNKVTIICPEHGEWNVTPNNFLRGSRCPGCFGTPKLTTEEFISKAKDVHGNTYDYSETVYDGNKKKVAIICSEHGLFLQMPKSHLQGAGCPICTGRINIVSDFKPKDIPLKRITTEIFIANSLANHEIKYDYSKAEYINGNKCVTIICPEHGEFQQRAGYHMHGGNCPKCVGGKRLTNEEFIDKATLIHEGKYDYSKVEYKNTATKVCIICPEHGEFFQTPNNHLFGAGCPTCPQSNLEGEMRQFLIKNNIEFEQEYSFKWLRNKKKLFLDFFLPDYNIAIECQGKQHFVPVDIFGGEVFFNKTIERDLIKRKLCEEHDIRVIYFSNAHIDYPYPVVETFEELKNLLV